MLNNTIGKNIKYYRNTLGLTQTELANMLYITRQALSSYEKGIRLPDINMLTAMADIFDITIDSLVGREREISGPNTS